MKRKMIIAAFISFLAAPCFAQYSAVDYKSDDYAQLKASRTYIVKTGDAKFDSELSSAVKDLWTLTPTEVIDDAEFKTKVTDKSASFIVSIIIGTAYAQQNYHYLALINGGRKKISSYSYDDLLAYCPINHWVNEPNNTDCSYRLRNMVESMVQAMDIVQKNDIHGNPKKIVDKLLAIYNSKATNIKGRTLLFCQEALGPKITKAEIAGVYPYKFEMCSKEKIEQVIKDKSKEYYYFQPGITLNKSMFVFDPSNGEVVYGDYQMMGLSINKGNIKDLAEAIQGKK